MTSTIMSKQFVVLTSPRSGSSYFCQSINTHPRVRVHREVMLSSARSKDSFHEFCWSGLRKIKYIVFCNTIVSHFFPKNRNLMRLSYSYFKSLFYNPEHSAPFDSINDWNDYHRNHMFNKQSAVGFKLMYKHLLRNGYLMDEVRSARIRVIRMRRLNHLRRYISQIKIKETGVCHTEKSIVVPRVAIDCSKVIAELEHIKREELAFDKLLDGLEVLDIYYERFVQNPKEVFSQVGAFLDVNGSEFDLGRMKKLNPSALHDSIVNYEELCRTLCGTEFEHFLNDES